MIFDPRILQIVLATLIQALLSTGIAAVLGLLMAAIAPLRFRGWDFLSLLYVLPTVAVGAWAATAAAEFQVPLGWALVIGVHVVLNAPLLASEVGRVWRESAERHIQVAQLLGMSRLSQWLNVYLPLARPVLVRSSAQIFSLCVGSFVLVQLLGGGPPVETLEVTLYSALRSPVAQYPQAFAVAVWEAALCFGALGLAEKLSGFRLERERSRKASEGSLGFFQSFALLGIGIAAWIGLALLLVEVEEELLQALSVTLRISLAVVICVLVLVFALSATIRAVGPKSWTSRGLSFFASFPQGISPMVLGFGLWVGLGRWVDPLRYGWQSMVAVQTLALLPLVLRRALPLARDPARRHQQAARLLGLSAFQAFFVSESHRWWALIRWTVGWVMALSWGEVAAVSLFAREETMPVSALISRWTSQYRFEEANRLSLVLTAGAIFWAVWGGWRAQARRSGWNSG